MKRYLRGAALFVGGLLVGLLVAGRDPRRPPPLAERHRPFTVRRDDAPAVYLVPYAVAVDGRSEVIGPKGSGPMWVMQFDGARVQVAASEQPDPR